MNHYRKLLVYGLNYLVENDLVNLSCPDEPRQHDEKGHVLCDLIDIPCFICWAGQSYGELEIRVFWDYNHDNYLKWGWHLKYKHIEAEYGKDVFIPTNSPDGSLPSYYYELCNRELWEPSGRTYLLAKRKHLKEIIGAMACQWVERKRGPYLMGYNMNTFGGQKYMRKGELSRLKALPTPIPKGFKAVG